MPRLAFILFKYFPYGGLQRDFMAIAMAAVAKGFNVDVYTMSWEGSVPSAFNVITIKSPGLTNHQKYCHFIKKLQEYREKTNYQAVIGFNKIPDLDFYYAADPCFANRKKFWHRFIPRYRWFLENEKLVFARDQATMILALSTMQIQQFQQSYLTPNNRFYLLPPWLTTTHFKHYDRTTCRQRFIDELKLPEKAKWMLQVGSGFRTKGLDRSLEALASLSQAKDMSACLIVIGQDNQKAFRRLAMKLGVASRVYFLGGRLDIAEWMHAADVLIHPAYSENTGNVLLEAIVAGLPVITTSTCGFAEYVTRAKAGIVIAEPFSQRQLNNSLLQLLTDDLTRPFNINDLGETALSTMPEQVISFIENHYVAKDKNNNPQISTIMTDEGWINNDVVLENSTLTKKVLNKYQFNWSAIFSVKGHIARKIKERETLKLELNCGNFYIKRFSPLRNIKTYFSCLLKKEQVSTTPEYKAIHRLKALNVPTLTVAGFGVEQKYLPRSFLLTEEINGVNLEEYTQYWLQMPPKRSLKLAVISQLAATLKVLHHYGINHRDCYLCHFWIDPTVLVKHGNISDLLLIVMDLHRAQLRKQVPIRWQIKDLSGLLYSAWQIPLTMRDLCRFIEVYSGRPWRDQLKTHKHFWQMTLKKAIRLRQREYRVGLVTPGNAWLKMMLAKMQQIPNNMNET